MSWFAKLKRRVINHLKRQNKEKAKKKTEFKTVRTSAIEKQLRRAGISEKEIKRLRGKK